MAAFDISSWLSAQRREFEGVLEDRLGQLTGPPSLLDAMAYALRVGGKRLRPILCLSFARALSEKAPLPPAAFDAACALEFVHTYSLIHDDLPSMDNADFRRGQPSCHKRFSEAVAILAGDALLTDAFALLASTPDFSQPLVRARLVSELALAAGSSGMVGGQAIDISPDRPSDESTLTDLHRRKTGALTRAACRMGAIVAGADEEALKRASQYGECLGLAFQIADDILDVTMSAEALGKPQGQDAINQRYTFVSAKGLEASRAMAEQLVARAVESVASWEPQGGPLTALARYVVERST